MADDEKNTGNVLPVLIAQACDNAEELATRLNFPLSIGNRTDRAFTMVNKELLLSVQSSMRLLSGVLRKFNEAWENQNLWEIVDDINNAGESKDEKEE